MEKVNVICIHLSHIIAIVALFYNSRRVSWKYLRNVVGKIKFGYLVQHVEPVYFVIHIENDCEVCWILSFVRIIYFILIK